MGKDFPVGSVKLPDKLYRYQLCLCLNNCFYFFSAHNGGGISGEFAVPGRNGQSPPIVTYLSM